MDAWVGQMSGQGQTKADGAELIYASCGLYPSFCRVSTVVTGAAGRATKEGGLAGTRRDDSRGTHRGRWFPSRHDADQREVLGLVTAEGCWCVSGHHLDGGGRSYSKEKHRKTNA